MNDILPTSMTGKVVPPWERTHACTAVTLENTHSCFEISAAWNSYRASPEIMLSISAHQPR